MITTRRNAIVTGAARGIGAAIAARLAEDGYGVALVDRDPAVHDVAAALGPDHHAAVVDLADAEATRTTFAALVEQLGGCWALVNNAGIFLKTPLGELSVDDWDRVQAVNARSMLLTTQAVIPAMRAVHGGRIVNIASMAAKLGTPGEAAYAASKAAVVALTRIAAMELGPADITVNAICPGYVLTDLGADTRDPGQVAGWEAQSPLGRLAAPDDVAATVSHLVSDDAAYVTGQALNVTGGMCTW
ncbi:MAG: SDR family NAD(P)-dependent oxidoreductase [Actinomycetota bacterium]